ncbi:pectate lyase-domain-containing protein [Aspergillus filifer]
MLLQNFIATLTLSSAAVAQTLNIPTRVGSIVSLASPNAISALGDCNVLIQGGGAQEAKDKVVQHNGRGAVTIKDFTVVNDGKLYRSCGNCSNNGHPRNVVIQNVKKKGVSELVGINSNYGDTPNISGSCGSNVKKVCQEYMGVGKGQWRESEGQHYS